ncbi:RluA family pseudouridine synthase, partial [Singulisphaera rosea]
VESNVEGTRRALTKVQEGRGGLLPARTSWLRLWPETGRTHQLRAQSSRRGRPILGDHAYGSSHPFPGGIALHARRLSLNHPILRQSIDVIAPLPADWARNGVRFPEAPSSGI